MKFSISPKQNYEEIKYLIKKNLQAGMSPHKIAVTVTLGILFGIIPILGVTTVLLAVIAVIFRLNLVLIQLANYLVYPIQLVLYLPLLKLSADVFCIDADLLHVNNFEYFWHAGFKHISSQILFIHIGAILAWVILSVPLIFLIYPLLRKILESRKPTIEYFR